MRQPTRTRTTRRHFLAAALASCTAPMVASAYTGRPGANGRYATGHVGLGARGVLLSSQPGIDPRALFDVDKRRYTDRALGARAGADTVESFRALLARKDIDAIVIATPDHWHAPMAIAAMEAGKDLYLESPCLWMPGEEKLLLDTARRWGVVVQTGETLPYAKAGAALKERLSARGDAPLEVHCTAPLNPMGGGFVESAPPPELDWAQWLGPARERPFIADYLAGQWRHVADLGGGHIRSAGTTMIATLLWAMGKGTPSQVQVSASDKGTRGLWDCPPDFSAEIVVDGRLTVHWRQSEGAAVAMQIGGETPLELAGLEEEAVLKEGGSAIAGPAWDGGPPTAHWAEAMGKREGARLPLECACAASVITQLCVLAWRTRATLGYDFAAGAISGSEAAARLAVLPGEGALHAWL